MFVYKKPHFKRELVRKIKPNKKAQKVLQRIQNILKRHENDVILYLSALWTFEYISELEVQEAIQNDKQLSAPLQRYEKRLQDFSDNELRPIMDNVGNAEFEETRNDCKPLMLEPPKGEDSLNDNNQFDYSVFYGQWCDNRAGNLISDLTDTQRENVKHIINDALNQGEADVSNIAQRINDTIGLNSRQLKSNQKYYNSVYSSLRENNPKMSDRAVKRKASAAAKKYADKQRSDRAKSIARSELVTAHNQASYSYVQWAIEHGYMKNIYCIWVTSGADNVCSLCLSLEGQKVPFGEPFKPPESLNFSRETVGLPPIHNHCCCGVRYVENDRAIPSPPSLWDSMTETEKKAHINYHSDKEQYERYKERLGAENVPETLEKFQKIKYNSNTEEWDNLQDKYSAAGPNAVRTEYTYSDKGTYIATNHRKSGSVPKRLKPYAVLDLDKKDGHIERTIYDENGYITKQIHPTNHGNPKQHPYGKRGEHTHVYTWKNDELSDRSIREMTKMERKENRDIL